MEEKNTKEINLLQLLNIVANKLVEIVKVTLNFIGYTFQLAVKHWVVTLIVILLSVAAVQYSAKTYEKRYKAGSVTLLHGTTLSTVKEVVRQLQNSLISEKSFSLAHKLDIPDSVANNIIAIQNYNIIDYLKDGSQDAIDFNNKHNLADTLNLIMQDRMYLQVITRKVSQLPVIQEALLKYMNNNSIVKGDYESTIAGLQEKIILCDKELSRLDSLAKVTYFKDADKKISLDNNRLVVGEQTKQLFYNDVLRLEDVKSNTRNTLVSFKQPIVFPSGLVVNPIPINGYVKYAAIGLFIGIVLALFIAYIFENLKKITNYLTSKSK